MNLLVKVKKISFDIRLILVLFLLTRFCLTAVGTFSQNTLTPQLKSWYVWRYSKIVWLDIWSAWDSGWYLDIAQNGYSMTLDSDLPKRTCCGQNNLGFFPLYPLTIRYMEKIIGSFHTAAILLSNIYLLISCLFIYKIAWLKFGKSKAVVAVLFFLFFPTSFLLSSVFSESLFIMLILGSLYFAEKQNWIISSVFGGLASLTKISGIMIFPILLLLYFSHEAPSSLRLKNPFGSGHRSRRLFPLFSRERNPSPRRHSLWRRTAEAKFDLAKGEKENRQKIFNRLGYLSFLLIPISLLIFFTYTFFKFGDFFAYFHVKQAGWSVKLSNPIITVTQLALVPNSAARLVFVYVIVFLILIAKSLISSLPFPYKIQILLFSLLPLFSGFESASSYPRLSLSAVGIFFYLSSIKYSKTALQILYFLLFAVQLIFMFYFSRGMVII